MTDIKEPSDEAKAMLIAMVKPVIHLVWSDCGNGDIRADEVKPDLPGRRFNRLDPGYGNSVDDDVVDLMERQVGPWGERYVIGPDLLERIRVWEKEAK